MNQKLMYKFFISSFIVLFSANILAQNDSIVNDSIVYKERFGLRLGADLNKLVRSFADDDYKGFEINADYRLTKNLYVAGELGTEDKTTKTDYLNTITSGSYFKAGVDYNVYENWFGMENMIYGGLRVGLATFKQERTSFTIYNPDQYWEPFTTTDSKEFSGLSAIWAELVVGIKAEVFNNLYLGINARIKSLVSDDQPDNFENIYIPGFNKTYDSSSIGVGFGYNISYLIPLYKKDK